MREELNRGPINVTEASSKSRLSIVRLLDKSSERRVCGLEVELIQCTRFGYWEYWNWQIGPGKLRGWKGVGDILCGRYRRRMCGCEYV